MGEGKGKINNQTHRKQKCTDSAVHRLYIDVYVKDYLTETVIIVRFTREGALLHSSIIVSPPFAYFYHIV